MEQPGCGRADSIHLHQILFRCFQHRCKVAKAVQQSVCQGVGIPPGICKVKKIFQCLMGSQAVKSIPFYPGVHPAAVTFMDLLFGRHELLRPPFCGLSTVFFKRSP